MGARDRLVRRVRLAADSEETLRHMLPRLEDALRCASLPDDSNRVLVVRKLALGPIAHDCSAQQLARQIEHRVAELGAVWQDGDSAEASTSDFVRFRNALEARSVLMRRLVRGESCSAWYWPLAVKEFRSGDTLRETTRKVATEIARWPEATAALPAWVAAVASVAHVGALDLLATSFSADEGAALLRWAGIDMRHCVSTSAFTAAAPEGAAQKPHEEATNLALPGNNKAPVPGWLAALLQRAGLSTQDRSSGMRGVDQGAVAAASLERPDLRVGRNANHANALSPLVDRSQEGSAPNHAERAPANASESESAANGVSNGAPNAHSGQTLDLAKVQVWLASTQCGGLPFLLPVLQSLGLPQWCVDDQTSAAIARRVLAAALLRLRVPAEDIAWSITPSHAHVDLPSVAAHAPAIWSDTALRAVASQRVIALEQALVLASTVDQQAQIWLTAVRRWLRRRAGIGLASLVLRPARLEHTATHLDMHFFVKDVDMRVRRMGLDSDPGWLPWFGKIVTYHYQERTA